MILGCGGSQHQSTSPTSSGSTAGYVPLTETIFMGDAILAVDSNDRWGLPPWANIVGPSHPVPEGGSLGLETAQAFADMDCCKCVSGCSPDLFQVRAPGKKRLVLIAGAFDASEICIGLADDFGYYEDTAIRGAQILYGMQVVVATVPQSYDSSGKPTCESTIDEINAQIKSIAKEEGAFVLDLNSALNSSADFTLGGFYGYTVSIPNANGYAAATAAYNALNR